MDNLSNNDIIDLIFDYLNEHVYNYAIMIDGSWGCGKTHFVKEILIPSLKEKINKSAIYISIYGIKNREEISTVIYTSIVENKLGKGKKLLPFANAGLNILSECIGNKFGAHLPEDPSIENTILPFINYEDYYFIFDDLERCSMQINDAMGYINYFVEQNNAKAIIIANQKEIKYTQRQDNLELKYFLATRQEIVWPQKENSQFRSQINSPGENASTKIDLSEIQRRCNYLFDENTFYLQIKEKLIGKTILYKPDLQQVVPNVFENCLSHDIMKIAQPYMKLVVDAMIENEYYNIRTLQFSLLFFSKVAKLIYTNKNDETEVLKETLSEVLLSIIKVSIYFKNGKPNYEWIDNSEYGTIRLNHNLWSTSSYILSFKFVHDYIYYSEYDNFHIKEVLKKYMQEKEYYKDKLEDPCNKLNFYMRMEDNEVEREIKVMYENLIGGKYKSESYRWIISILYAIKGIEIEPIPVEKFIKIIQDDVSKGNSIRTDQSPAICKEAPCFIEYTTCMEQLIKISQNTDKSKSINKINATFNKDEGWGNEFCSFCKEHHNEIMNQNEFFKLVDVNKCAKKILSSSVRDIISFREGILEIYDFSNIKDFYISDGENIKKLKQLLQNKKIDGKIKKLNMDFLLKDLDKILDSLDYP